MIASAAATLVLSMGAPRAGAALVLDAECVGPSNASALLLANQRLAQTFTAQTTGGLARADIEITKPVGPSGDWTMQIYATDGSGTPTNSLLGSTTISDLTVPAGNSRLIGTFTVPASVHAGEQYALSLRRSVSWTVRDNSANPCAGMEFFSSSPSDSWALSNGNPDYDMVFATFVEPASQPGMGDLQAPSTTITKGPKDKTKKKTATFEFTGTDARAVASFECKLDSGAFTPCTSPHTVKVKKGKHTFEVQAVDGAGNVGAPASDTWKRKRKK